MVDINDNGNGQTPNRRAQRRRTLTGVVNVVNQFDEVVLGRLVNITTEGLMLVSPTALATDTLYQTLLALPEELNGVRQIELGMDCLWTSPTHPDADMYWSGCHIIDISQEMMAHLLVLIEEFGD
jgi:hypothetical protein